MKPFKSATCGLALAMVALAGCSSASGEAASKPAEDWSRFWLADPFANTARLKIKHLRAGGEGETYVIDTQHPVVPSVDPISIRYLGGAEVDFVDTITGGGFTIKNPTATSTCGCGSSFSVD